MKFLICKKTSLGGEEGADVTDFKITHQRWIDVGDDGSEEELFKKAKEKYEEEVEFEDGEEGESICMQIEGGLASLPIETLHCQRIYQEPPKIVIFKEFRAGGEVREYPWARLIGVIPADEKPTREDLLNFAYRGDERCMEFWEEKNPKKFAADLKKSHRDRICVDLGSKSYFGFVGEGYSEVKILE